MSLREIEYNKVDGFSKLLIEYASNNGDFSDLITNFPSLDNLNKQISYKSKNYDNKFRERLVKEIGIQYNDIELTELQKSNIKKLAENKTFTITTGHQLNLLTGPMYFIYKIISVVNLCEKMQKEYSKFNFVPIFWMASEDHDFEEINNFSFQGSKFKWSSNQTGVVGEFKLDSINDVIIEFEKYVSDSSYSTEIIEIFRECYMNSNDLSSATRKLVNILFRKNGLIIIDANNKNLKTLFCDIIKKEINEKVVFNQSKKSIQRLNELNYNIQANPREINLFYIDDGKRERIIEMKNGFQTSNGLKKWSLEQIQDDINDNPEKFSPNVLFRPIFQEYILPNICYIGGPAEVAYWLQLKSVFESLNLTFPVILNRNSALLLDKKLNDKLNKLNVSIEEILMPEEILKEKLVKKYSKLKLDFTNLKQNLTDQFLELKKIASQTDKSFIGALNAQEKKQVNGLEMLEKRLMNSEQRIHQDKIKRVLEIRDKLFPKGIPQERISNFSEFYVNEGINMISLIKNNLDPLSHKFSVIEI